MERCGELKLSPTPPYRFSVLLFIVTVRIIVKRTCAQVQTQVGWIGFV